MIAVIFLSFTLVTLYILLRRQASKCRDKSLPPAVPWKLPFLGHMLSLGLLPHETLLKWGDRYGPVFMVHFGGYPAVVINDGMIMRRAFSSSAMAGRRTIRIFDEVSRDGHGLLFTDGLTHAREHRLFFMKNLKELTTQLDSMEWRILQQIQNMKASIESNVGKPLKVRHFFNRNIVNALFSVVISKNFEVGDETVDQFSHMLSTCFALDGPLELAGMFIPVLANWFPDLVSFTKRVKICRAIQDFMKKLIDEHRTTWVRNQPRDLIDVYFDRSAEVMADPTSGFHRTSENLLISMFDLFAAGSETTSSQIEWIIYELCQNPRVQQKLQQEIDRVIGDRPPSLHDRISLTYAEAVILETCRHSTLVPVGVPHSAVEDCELKGYRIPKGTIVLGNIYAAHNNKAVWGDPEVFRPERFIDEEGRLVRSEHLVPFGWGKRSCFGETLARQQMFMYIVSILQKYSFRAVGPMSTKLIFGLTISPPPFEVIFTHRRPPHRVDDSESKAECMQTFGIRREPGRERSQ